MNGKCPINCAITLAPILPFFVLVPHHIQICFGVILGGHMAQCWGPCSTGNGTWVPAYEAQSMARRAMSGVSSGSRGEVTPRDRSDPE